MLWGAFNSGSVYSFKINATDKMSVVSSELLLVFHDIHWTFPNSYSKAWLHRALNQYQEKLQSSTLSATENLKTVYSESDSFTTCPFICRPDLRKSLYAAVLSGPQHGHFRT